VNPTSGEESFARLNGGDILVEGPAHFPAQFELGAEANRNWQGRIDEKIKLTVMTALHWDLAVPRDRVRVSVSRGWVTLTGRVAREYEKSRAEADARATSGVAGVTNRLSCEAGN
jgi:osmotically-inducible protein OsmY